VTQAESRLSFDLNLAVMEDEALVVLAQECEFGPARDELIVRYGTQTHRHIGWLAFRYQLNDSDAEDARQNAVFWIIEAAAKYDTSQIGKAHGCSFRTFIHRVIMARFKDFAKHLRRVECHYDRTARCGGEEASAVDIDRKLNDPAALAESQEAMNRFQETITRLDAESARLWRLLASGFSLRQIAAELGISYDSAKRRRRKLIAQLRIRLNPSSQSAPSFSESMALEDE
jgi:RNA polymerase sigma factor (sigma-70 family)